jgi:hypothetical protein
MRSTRRRIVATALVGAALAVAAGCGGGDDSSDATTTVSAEAFRTQVSSICTDFNAKIDAVDAPTSAAGIKGYFDTTIPLAQAELDQLKAVAVPADLQASYAEAMTLQEQKLEIATQLQTRIGGGEDAETVFNELNAKVEDLDRQSDAKADELGVPDCKGSSDANATTAADATPPPPATTTAETTAGAAATPATTYPAPSRTGTAAEFQRDMTRYARELSAFGTTLQAAAQSPEALRGKAAELNAQLDALDATTGRLARYEMAESRFERIRGTVVAKMGIVTATGRELITEAQAGDKAAVEALVARMETALNQISASLKG